MTPILCVGETLEEREAGTTDEKVKRQIEAAFQRLPADDAARCIIAYEPIWAIGTGRTATPDDANADGLRILYGGSVKPGNVAELMEMPEIDGGLVGGASLDPDEFARIVQYGAR